jgi:hypothetical protein
VRDEPSANEFAKVAAQVKRIQAVDERRPCYVNLFPSYASTGPDGQLGTATYQEYVDRFVREVPVPVLSFDYYPVVGGLRADEAPSLRAGWYENLEIITAAANRTGKPMWAFALSCAHSVHPPPTAAHLRLQVYSNLAYGAQVIQYFTYWTPEARELNFREAPIATDGTRTATYDLVKEMNRELQAMRGVFLGAKVLRVGHTGDKLPSGTRAYQPVAPVKVIKTEGQGAVVSHLSNAGRRFLVVVNRDINGSMPLTVVLDDAARTVERVEKDGSLHPVTAARFESQVAPGDACVLSWVTPAE